MRHTKLTEHTEPIVHGDHDDISIGCKDAAIKHVPWALHVGASVDEEHHRLLAAIPNICTNTNNDIRYFHVRSFAGFSLPHTHDAQEVLLSYKCPQATSGLPGLNWKLDI